MATRLLRSMTFSVGMVLSLTPLVPEVSAANLTYIGYRGSPANVIEELALQEGFFEKNGIEVQYAAASSGSQLISAVIGGSADIGILSPTHTIKLEKQNQCFVYLTNGVRVFYNIIAQPDLELPHSKEPFPGNLVDLADKKIAVSARGSIMEILLNVVFKEAGLDVSKLNYVPTGGTASAVAAFRSRQVDVGISFPMQEQLFKPDEFKFVQKLMETEEHNPIFQFMQTFNGTTCEYAERNPDKVRAFCKSIAETYDFAKNPDNNRAVVSSISKSLGVEFHIAESFWRQYAGLYSAPGITKSTWSSQQILLPDGEEVPVYEMNVSSDCLAAIGEVRGDLKKD